MNKGARRTATCVPRVPRVSGEPQSHDPNLVTGLTPLAPSGSAPARPTWSSDTPSFASPQTRPPSSARAGKATRACSATGVGTGMAGMIPPRRSARGVGAWRPMAAVGSKRGCGTSSFSLEAWSSSRGCPCRSSSPGSRQTRGTSRKCRSSSKFSCPTSPSSSCCFQGTRSAGPPLCRSSSRTTRSPKDPLPPSTAGSRTISSSSPCLGTPCRLCPKSAASWCAPCTSTGTRTG